MTITSNENLQIAKDLYIQYENEIATNNKDQSFLSWIGDQFYENEERRDDIAYDSIDEDRE